MRTAPNRRALLALAALAAAGCSYNRIEGAIELDVTGMPANAVRAELVATDSTGQTTTREPHFGAGVYVAQTLVLTLPPIASGAFTVQVTAYDLDNNTLAVGNGGGDYQPATGPDQPLPVIPIALGSSGLQGTYGTPCIPGSSGAVEDNTCNAGLVCQHYTASDQGVCTSACDGDASCESINPTGATCEAFEGVLANMFCQWECDADGGSCPAGLACGSPIASSGGKRFCQGSP